MVQVGLGYENTLIEVSGGIVSYSFRPHFISKPYEDAYEGRVEAFNGAVIARKT